MVQGICYECRTHTFPTASQNVNGIIKQLELPQSSPIARTLTASLRNNIFTVGILKAAHSPDIPCYLLAHCRGMVFHFTKLNNNDELIAFPIKALPAGIIQLILLDE